MANVFVSISSVDDSVSRAFEHQVREFLSYLREQLHHRIEPGVQEHEIRDELRSIATGAFERYQLRWRLLDYLAYFDPEPYQLESRRLLANFIRLTELALRDSIPLDDPSLSGSVRELYSGRIRWAPLDIFRTINTGVPNLLDFGGYEESVRKGTYIALQLKTSQLFRHFGLVINSSDQSQGTSIEELTASQRDAYQTLAHFLDLRLNPRVAAGIQPRPHPLIVGPSGIGKTALVRAFAEDITGERGFRCPIYYADPGTWLPDGARSSPHTLESIREWMLAEVDKDGCGIVLLDELDKMTGEHDWSRSVVQNVFALLDNRLGSTSYWTQEDSRFFQASTMIIGCGTWQSAQRESLSDPGNITRRGARMDRIETAMAIPEELLFRFSADVIFLDPMLETEIQERIARIHRELGEPVPKGTKLAKLAHKAASSNRQVRWLEAYVSRLLRRRFLANRSKEQPINDQSELGMN